MSFKVEKIKDTEAKLIIEVPAEDFDKAIDEAYEKNKDRFKVDGFRKGKVPREMIEKIYGVGVFYDDAANAVIPEAYAEAAKESGLEIVARPDIQVTKIAAGNPMEFEAIVTLKPEVKLGKYKGVKVEKVEAEVTDEDIEKRLEQDREQNTRLVAADDKEIEEGDQAIIDFEGFVDDKPFEGGKGEDYPLVIGSHSFIDTFEDQLVGKKVGDEVDVNVTFPEQYQAEELAGKPALFKVKVKEIKVKELPELDDEFAQEVSEFDTLDEYKEDIKKKLQEAKENEAKRETESRIIEAIIKDSEMDIPEKMIDTACDQMVEEFARNMQMQGIAFEQYLQMTGSTLEQMKEQVKPQAEARVQSSLVLEAIVDAENIEAKDADVDDEILKMSEQYGMEVEKINEMLRDEDRENIKKDICIKKAADLIMDEAK